PLGIAMSAAFVVSKVVGFFKDSSTAAKAFELALSQLKSITGASAEDMEFYNEQAQRIGATTTLSASQAVDAFKLIGSAKPDLLANRDALVAVTQEAITLAEAAGITLPEAAGALTKTLNQFNLGAEESSRVINVLAAGSKFGAGDINYLNDSIGRFGPTAAAMNISIEESAAAMELFAEKGIDSEKAGTAFRNVLVELAKGADETNPEIVGMQTALENLGKQNLSTAELAARFGTQSLTVAQILSTGADRVKYFTDALTGTKVAYEQAAINVDNLAGAEKAYDSIVESLTISIGTYLNKALREYFEMATKLLFILKETPKFIKENQDLFYALGFALITLNAQAIAATAATIAHTVAERARSLATQAAVVAQNLLNAAMTANPIGLIIKGVALLGAGFIVLYNRSETVRAGIQGIWESLKALGSSAMDILSAIAKGDISGMVNAFKNIGTNMADGFNKGYADKIASEREAAQEEELVYAAAHAEEKIAIEEEVTEKVKAEAEEQKKARIQKQKEAEAELQKAREKAAADELKAKIALEDLKIQAMHDAGEREIAKINTDFARKIEALVGNEAQITEQKLLLEAERDLKLQEATDARVLAQKEKKLEEIALEEEMEALRLEEKFLLAIQTEQERDAAMLDLKKLALQQRLAVLEEAGLGETLQAMKFKGEILKIEQQKHDQSIAAEKMAEDAKRRIWAAGYSAAHDFVDLGIELLSKDEAAKKKNANTIKAFARANILINSAKEIQGIWMNAMSNPLNAIVPGAGSIIAGVQTALALMRTRKAVLNVDSAGFYDGGFTGSGLTVGASGKLKDRSGHTVAGVVHANEWVAPQWMTTSPRYADILGYLEAERTGKRGFAEGGFTSPASRPAPGASPTSAINPELFNKMIETLFMIYEEQKTQNENIRNWATGLHVNNNLTDVDKGLKMLYELQRDSAIRR
nr:phage tail tape measure protein [Bacteroidota bacterium]